MRTLLLCSLLLILLSACSSQEEKKQKGIALNEMTLNEGETDLKSKKPSEGLMTRPSNVLLTGHAEHRLVTVYKVNYDAKRERNYIGSNYYHRRYSDEFSEEGNAWHYHFMPGLEALYGYNLLNVAHYNVKTKKRNNLFEQPVLINTLYYPSLVQDTLNGKPVARDFYLVSVYDEDTNKDSLVNHKDLRRFYRFDLEGKNKESLVPPNYSVMSSEYDSENDIMYVFARLDKNSNGRRDENEPVHVFWLGLKGKGLGERLY